MVNSWAIVVMADSNEAVGRHASARKSHFAGDPSATAPRSDVGMGKDPGSEDAPVLFARLNCWDQLGKPCSWKNGILFLCPVWSPVVDGRWENGPSRGNHVVRSVGCLFFLDLRRVEARILQRCAVLSWADILKQLMSCIVLWTILRCRDWTHDLSYLPMVCSFWNAVARLLVHHYILKTHTYLVLHKSERFVIATHPTTYRHSFRPLLSCHQMVWFKTYLKTYLATNIGCTKEPRMMKISTKRFRAQPTPKSLQNHLTYSLLKWVENSGARWSKSNPVILKN